MHHGLIHRSAWNRHSRKFLSSNLVLQRTYCSSAQTSPLDMSMVSSLRGHLTPREGAGQLPALLLDQGQLPILLSSYHWLCWEKGKPAAEGGHARPKGFSIG
jgi:hypothetical protein